MKGTRFGLSALLLVAAVSGCGGGGGGNGQGGVPGLPGTGPNGNNPPGGAPVGIVKALGTVQMPKGFEEPRGIALDGTTIFVTAREVASDKAVILKILNGNSQVLYRGDVPGTHAAMTNPVALAFGSATLYVADMSSDFAPGAAGAVLSIDMTGKMTVLSAGMIDAPTGVMVQSDGSLAVCGSDPLEGQGAVFKVTTTGTSMIAKGGALTQPTGLGADANGTIFVSDAGSRMPHAQLVSVSANGGTPALVSEITDTCSAESGVAIMGNNTFVATRHGNAGRLSAVAGSSEQIGYEGTPLVAPNGITTNGLSLYVADQDANGAGQILILN
ncbi:MAG: hypothetical protein ACAI25_20865 [Planctomycetota bacterium]